MDFCNEATRRTFTSVLIRALPISFTMESKAVSLRVGERVKSETAVLMRRPMSWRTMVVVWWWVCSGRRRRRRRKDYEGNLGDGGCAGAGSAVDKRST